MTSQSNSQPAASASELKRAEAGAEKGAAPGNVSETCQACIAADCKKKIEEIDKETKRITDIEDPIARNKEITAAYKSLFSQDPTNHWLKLGSIVSSQVGCNMNLIQGKRDGFPFPSLKDSIDSTTGVSFSKNMMSALGEGNKAIFRDIYPLAAYRARHGFDDLKKCYAAQGKEIPPQMKDALARLEKNDSRGSADLIGDYEQKQIIQPVYQKYDGTFFMAENIAGPVWKTIYKHYPYEIPVSSSCSDTNIVEFPGSISNMDDRVLYYHKLMDRLSSQEGWSKR
ncbi:DUF2515 family protein [Allorhizobium taibaishanense]|uniref:Uncharacterized protein n=1 Tax=Allorhizobium taibaishanense TaxID=887144 RepID=A0A7W6HSM1_9HYPH|nr:hypothetical protein [Allorhizobium taibaishanense]MBB4010687.1 hypothetical protein [Allorhizobium taibaishanense]